MWADLGGTVLVHTECRVCSWLGISVLTRRLERPVFASGHILYRLRTEGGVRQGASPWVSVAFVCGMDLACRGEGKKTRMLKNFLKVAWRNLSRGKSFSFINISGLAVGMASALLILLWVQNELSYDGFYTHSDRLYQVWRNGKDNTGISSWNITPQILGPAMKQEYPEVERVSRVFWDETLLLSRDVKKINTKGTMVDPDFLLMFDLPLVQGDRNTALNGPTQMVITEKTAKAFFGNEDPIGKTIRVDNRYEYAVSAVLKDLPNNTQFDFAFLLPWNFVHLTQQDDSMWDKNSTHTYIQLKPHSDLAAFNAKTKDIYAKHHNPYFAESFLYPVSRLRL